MTRVGKISPVMNGIEMSIRGKLDFRETVGTENPEAALGIVSGSVWARKVWKGLAGKHFFLEETANQEHGGFWERDDEPVIPNGRPTRVLRSLERDLHELGRIPGFGLRGDGEGFLLLRNRVSFDICSCLRATWLNVFLFQLASIDICRSKKTP